MNHWLVKSEPSKYSWEKFVADGETFWDGVRNYQARNNLNAMQADDLVLFYHSSTTPPGVAGIAKIVKSAYPDPTQFQKTSSHFDPKSKKENPTWCMVDVAFVKQFSRLITRDELKCVNKLNDMKLWTHNRLSILPISEGEFEAIVALNA